MERNRKLKFGILAELLFLCLLLVANSDGKEAQRAASSVALAEEEAQEARETQETRETQGGEEISWVDFDVSSEALSLAYEADIDTYGTDWHADWISLLAYGAAKNGGSFGAKTLADMKEAVRRIREERMDLDLEGETLPGYAYYKEAYGAVLGGMVGEFLLQEDDGGTAVWRRKYGLKAFSPIAKGFPYSDYDDFGASRSYGYERQHLGHDMMGQIGTPIIAIESGYVEALGWNQYGGWRLGIRSFDRKRYYYYAHLRQDYPYAEGLKEGDVVTAGDVIGYMGHTGYSETENVNNIKTVHLHWGIELIFDEAQKESDNEIWIDCYQLSRFLSQNRSEAVKVGDTREWERRYGMEDPAAEAYGEGLDEL